MYKLDLKWHKMYYLQQFAVDEDLDSYSMVFIHILCFSEGRKPEQVWGLSGMKYADFDIGHKEFTSYSGDSSLGRKKGRNEAEITESQESNI